MSKRKGHRRRGGPSPGGLGVRRTTDGRSWVFVHPRCARDTAEDLEEVRLMIDAGEHVIALDELRWLLADCAENMAEQKSSRLSYRRSGRPRDTLRK